MQTYVQASLVAAAYLQAKDEINYNKWKKLRSKKLSMQESQFLNKTN